MSENSLPSSGKIELNNVQDPFTPVDQNLPAVNPNIESAPVEKESTTEVVTPEPEVIPFQSNDNIPPAEDNSEGISQRTWGIAAVTVGILIMIGGFIAYKYFTINSSRSLNVPTAEVQVQNEVMDDLNGRIAGGVSTSRADEWESPGDSFGIVQLGSTVSQSEKSDSSNIAVAPTPTKAPSSPATAKPKPEEAVSTWKANNYKQGDIKSGTYNVVRGDTLWEIAEAVYGNGNQWHKIADANNVSYLPNGNPLILPGQSLTVPI